MVYVLSVKKSVMCKLFVEFLLIRFFSVLNPAFSVREELTDVSALSFKKKKKKDFGFAW